MKKPDLSKKKGVKKPKTAVSTKKPETTVSEKALETQHKKDKEIVKKGIVSFIETGNALLRIRTTESFRLDGYDNFESFCNIEFEMTPQYGNRLIIASQTIKALPESTQPLIKNERQARELAKAVEPEKVIATVAATGAVTAPRIAEEVKKQKAPVENADYEETPKLDHNGTPIPKALM